MSKNTTQVLNLMLSVLTRVRAENAELREQLASCKAELEKKPFTENLHTEKCDFGFVHQETPCGEGVKSDHDFEAGPENGYCCESMCDFGEVHYLSRDLIPSNIDFENLCTGNVDTGYCCDPL